MYKSGRKIFKSSKKKFFQDFVFEYFSLTISIKKKKNRFLLTLKTMRTAAGFTTRPDSHSFSAHSFHGTFHGINSPWATAIFQPFYTSPRNVFAFQPGLWIRGRVFKGGRWILIPASSRKKRSFSSFPIESMLLRARYSLNGWLNCVKIRLKERLSFFGRENIWRWMRKIYV